MNRTFDNKSFCFTYVIIFIFLFSFSASGQKWTNDGYYNLENNEIIKVDLPETTQSTIVSNEMLIPQGEFSPIEIEHFAFSADQKKVLIFTNTKLVWRIRTRGDYWLLDLSNKSLIQLGKSLPESSLMFAKLSPDGNYAAYVSNNNIYVEDLKTNQIRALTSDGTQTLINGTFDWAYEEEFFCRDGFRWAPDSKSIAFWQLDASKIGKFYMINNTDSIHPVIIPIEYPLVGEKPSSCRVGIIDIRGEETKWINLPGEPDQNYIIRMEFIPWSNQILFHQINRKQNESRLFVCDLLTGNFRLIYEEKDDAWVDVFDYSSREEYEVDFALDYSWLYNRKSLIWISEKDGWRHFYEISPDGKPERTITNGNFDILELSGIDEKNGLIYYLASPDNATQRYLYRCRIDGKGKQELISPVSLQGSHSYSLSPDCRYGVHGFSNYFTRPSEELITIKDGKPLNNKKSIVEKTDSLKVKSNVEFFKVTTSDSVTMDGWMVKPVNFDPAKKYPVVFEVYTEPWEATVKDHYGIGRNFLYAGNMAADGYIYISLDNRGTPAPKGREWRKVIYRQIGRLNIRDQAMAAAEIIKWPFVDPDRIAVWGWSGGGAATLNLMFQYPEIYKTGIAIAAVSNHLTYDNIYTERYMGLPQENMEDFIQGSPVTYAKNLKGNLLIVHGTGDDNVHYQNAEMLLNELIKYNKK
ncbi:MAG TPA: DPP IV N-terminal domain-containing protein, partial [Bacteroidales bacterium]|nr:DPP IV N-terminal domain-containing protein [Bacteroidales bacterium]